MYAVSTFGFFGATSLASETIATVQVRNERITVRTLHKTRGLHNIILQMKDSNASNHLLLLGRRLCRWSGQLVDFGKEVLQQIVVTVHVPESARLQEERNERGVKMEEVASLECGK